MDVVRADLKRRKKWKVRAYLVVAVAVLSLTTMLLLRLKPAVPSLPKGAVWTDVVKRGMLVRKIRGTGVLVPEKIWWIAADVGGTVRDLPVQPGALVEPGTVIVELSNHELTQAELNARLRVEGLHAEFTNLSIKLKGEVLDRRAALNRVEFDLKQAQMDVEVNEDLSKDGLVAELTLKRSKLKASELASRYELEKASYAFAEESVASQLLGKRNEVTQIRSQHEHLLRQVQSLNVKAGVKGILQRLTPERGQTLASGATVAQVVNNDSLKAVIRISELQAKDIRNGLSVQIDTRNGVVPGTISRVDPAVENGTVAAEVVLTGKLPEGARPDLSIDGEVEIGRIDEAVYVRLPVNQEANVVGTVYRLVDHVATRTRVHFGRTSLADVEVLEGLRPGETIIVSDVSRWGQFEILNIE